MPDQPTTPPTSQQLDEIEARANARRAALSGWINCYSPLSEQEALENAEAVLEDDMPVLVAEVRRLRATPPMVCINCETPVGWVDCPTGGWWAHERHPVDGHDADPRPARPAAAPVVSVTGEGAS